MNKEDKNTHRMIGQMILVDHILEKRRKRGKAFRVRTAPPRPKSSREISVRPKTTRPELKLKEDEEDETFPSWLQNRKTFRSIMNESVETIVNNNKALTTYFYKQKSRPSLATSFKVKQYASINDLERILNARKRESERREQDSCEDRHKSDDLVTKKHLLHSLTRNTELQREFEENARLGNNQHHHHKIRNSSLHHRRSSNLSLGVSSSSTKHKWNWKRRWTEQMMARHLSRSDLRMLRVLREASEQDQMRRKLERIRIKESHEKNHMKLHLSTTTSQSGDSNQNEDIFEMVEKDGEVEKNGTQKTRTSIETPRSRFLRECSESMELTGPQMFGIAVLKRDD